VESGSDSSHFQMPGVQPMSVVRAATATTANTLPMKLARDSRQYSVTVFIEEYIVLAELWITNFPAF